MRFGPLVTAGWLAAHLEHDGLAVVDCRWYLGEPTRGRAAYEASHIRGAIYMDLEADLSASDGPGRHPLPLPDVLAAALGAKGIEPGTTVVAYDDRSGAVAARLWWLLRDLGHEDVGVLDGGLECWPRELTTAEVPPITPRTYPAGGGTMPRVDRAAVEARLATSHVIDARAAERYRGDHEPVDPIAGHIPSALSSPLTENLQPDGRFKPPDELHRQFAALGVEQAGDVISYCGSGVTACHNILAMEVAGLGTATLYPGSWSDWATAGMPVAIGPDPGR